MITVKEEFLGSVKTKRAMKLGGSDSVVLWLALKGYVSAGNTGGFIPTEAIPDLSGVPRNWRKAMTALVECGKLQADGARGPGLVEEVQHGYQLHDYEDHGTPVEVEDERRRKARDQKRRRRDQLKREAEARALAEWDAGGRVGPCPVQSTGQSPDTSGRQRADSPTVQSAGKPPRANGRAPARERDPQPSPAQPSPNPKAVDVDPSLTSGRVELRPIAAAAAPTNLDEALQVPISDRARLLTRDPHMADWLEPERWPEVVELAEVWGDARLGHYARDSGVRAAVELFAADYTPDEATRAARAIMASPWAKRTQANGGRLGLSSMTPEAVRRALDEKPQGQSMAEKFRNG